MINIYIVIRSWQRILAIVCQKICIGPKLIGPKYIGPKCIGPKCIGPKCIGPKCIGPKCIGPKCIGPKCIGPKCIGPKCIGPKCIEPKCIGPKCIGPKCIGQKYIDKNAPKNILSREQGINILKHEPINIQRQCKVVVNSQLDCRVAATTVPSLSKSVSSTTRNSLWTARAAPASANSSRERALTVTIFISLPVATAKEPLYYVYTHAVWLCSLSGASHYL